MKVLYFDCSSGISGDMVLAALVDVSDGKEYLEKELKKLNLPGYEIEIVKKAKNSIMMVDVNVRILPHAHDGLELHVHDEHEHGHIHRHSHDELERNYFEICSLIDASKISEGAKNTAKKIFEEVAKSEAKVHGKSIEEVHFHEVGAIDSIVDIAGTAIMLDHIKADQIICSPLHDGYGHIECRHGIMPVPVPAVAAMLEGSGIPIISEDVATELVTPTGCAIAKVMADSFGQVRGIFAIEKTGYGMGKRETGLFGALRVILGNIE